MPDGDEPVAEEGDANVNVHPEGAHQTPDGSHEAEDGHVPGIVEHAGAVRRDAVGVQPKIPAAASNLGLVASTPLSAYLGVIAYFLTPAAHVAPSGAFLLLKALQIDTYLQGSSFQFELVIAPA